MHDTKYCSLAQTNLREIQDNPSNRYLTGVCQRIKAKRGKIQRGGLMYDKCRIHLVVDGATITIDNTSGLAQQAYQQAI
jgi:hypothetical protein